MLKVKVRISMFLFIFISLFHFSADERYRFRQISVEDGLPSNKINSILQDDSGFMWIGTNDGLIRFDGVHIRNNLNGTDDPINNSSKIIRNLYKDRSGTIWVGTSLSGLYKIDSGPKTLEYFKPTSRNGVSFKGKSISSVIEDRSGMIWIGTNEEGLYRYDRISGNLSCYKRDLNSPKSLSHYSISSIIEDRSGILWICTFGGGLNRYNKESDDFTHYKNINSGTNILCNNFTSIFEDHSNNLWIGTLTDGIIKFDRTNMIFKNYKHRGIRGDLSDNYVSEIFEDSTNTLWIGTGYGLNKYDWDNDSFISYYKNSNSSSSLSSNLIYSIFEDDSGMLWFGTDEGINLFSRDKNIISLFRNDPNDPNSLNSNSVYAIDEDSSGNIWIGTENGLNKFDRKKNKYIRYYSNNIFQNKIISLVADRKGLVWIGSHNGILEKFDPENENFHKTVLDGDKKAFGSFSVNYLFEDSFENLWIAGYANGLIKLDVNRNLVKRYLHDPVNPNSLVSNTINSISEGKSGVLWLCTNYGLIKFDQLNEKFTTLKQIENNLNSLNSDNVSYAAKDRNGNLWIGTVGNGLNKLDLKTNTFSTYKSRDGLPSNFIFGILIDSGGKLWLSTGKGLSRMDPLSETFNNFDISDGIQSYEYSPGVCLKAENGEMYFGGMNGFNIVDPEKFQPRSYIPPVLITSIEILSKNGTSEKTIEFDHTIDLYPEDYNISFNFATLDYSNPLKNKYEYQLDGLEDNWVKTDGKKPFAAYTTLPSGKYIFKVRGSNSDGIWSEKIATINLVVHPPFWQTWWFILIVSAFLIGVIFQLYRIKLKRAIAKMEYKSRIEYFCKKSGLSDRECEVLGLLLEGNSNKEIEDLLFISQNTVRNHVYNIYQKLKINSRVQLLKLFENSIM